MGSGGVGGYFGARLAAAGARVTFVARGVHLEAMKRDGLKVESIVGNVHLTPTDATHDPADVHDPVDCILLATKAYDVANAARQIAPIVGPATTVVTLLNGVNSHEMVGAVVSPDRVIPGIAYVSAHIVGPGRIAHHGRAAKIVFGELSGQRSPRCERLLAACQKARFEADVSADIMKALWAKFVFHVPLAGVSCLTRLPLDIVRSDAATAGLLQQAADEVVAVAKAKGIGVERPNFERVPRSTAAAAPVLKPSMLVDLERGRPIELDWASTYIVEEGRRLGVATPVNAVIAAALAPWARGKPE